MRHHILWLFLPAVALGAAEESLTNLVFLHDRLELNPRVGLGGRYDSNVYAVAEDAEDELAAIGMVGAAMSFAWSEVTTFSADGEARLVLTDRPDEHWRNQGDLDLGLRRRTLDDTFAAHLGYARSDEPDDQTGERLLVDTWSAALNADRTGQIHRLSGGLSFDRSDYQDPSRAFGEDERDANTYAVTVGYGLRLESGDELSLRLVGDRRDYDETTLVNQDSYGARALVGWNREVSETIGLSLEIGAEYRRYEATDARLAEDILSPAWLVNGRTRTANDDSWSVTLSGGVEDSIEGNPTLASRANLAWTRPFTPSWSLRTALDGYHLYDLESQGGEPKDERWTVGGLLGSSYALRPGLSLGLDGRYEYSDSKVEGDYDRIVVQAGVIARF